MLQKENSVMIRKLCKPEPSTESESTNLTVQHPTYRYFISYLSELDSYHEHLLFYCMKALYSYTLLMYFIFMLLQPVGNAQGKL